MTDSGGIARVLLITRNFPPQQGGMEKLNWHIADELSKYCSLQVIAPIGASGTGLATQCSVIEVPLSGLVRFFVAATWHAINVARKERPTMVLAGSGLTAPIAWIAARLCAAKAVVYAHGLDITVPNIFYRFIWLPFLRSCDRVLANSSATAGLAAQSGIRRELIGIVNPGVNVPPISPSIRARFRSRYGFADSPLLISVGRLTQRKGILEFVKHSLPTIVNKYPDCIYLIVGDTPIHALYAETVTPESIRSVAEIAGVNQNIIFAGTPSDTELCEIYQSADVHVFPVIQLPNNPEGFGMVAIEAAANGLVTVAFSVGGVPDAVAVGQSGVLLQAGNYQAFAEAVIEQLNADDINKARTRVLCRQYAEGFAWPNFGKKLVMQLINSAT